jgi:hypothetical protein
VEQQNELETPGLFVNPLYQAVPDAYSHDNPPSALIRTSTSRASRAIRIYPQLFAGANSAEHLLQGRIPKYLAARRLDLKLPRREPWLQDRATLKTSHQGHFEMLFEQCDDQLNAAERIHQLRDEVVQRLSNVADQARDVTLCNLA